MILLEPANTTTHFNGEIKRRTISLTGDVGSFDGRAYSALRPRM
jgi:hypothetical protein